jgi:hypothetical protein
MFARPLRKRGIPQKPQSWAFANDERPTTIQDLRYTPAPMETTNLRDYATDAIKFWEPFRLLYNLALAAVVITYFAIGYPLSKSVISVDFCLGLFLLAVIANVAYCAAYIVDIFAQASGFREVWRQYRKLLFVIGTLFAAVITRFVAMGMFPGNR